MLAFDKRERNAVGENELPDNKKDRVDWVIRAPDNMEMRDRYNEWASIYDADVGSEEDYLSPIETAKVAAREFNPPDRILDAGAGTGLLGEALQEFSFSNLVAIDFAEQMLAIARAKGIYTELRQADLNNPTDFEAASFDGVVSTGTTTQVPCQSLREYARLVRPGGKIVFAVVDGPWEECGYAAVLASLEDEGAVEVVSRGDRYQAMPTTEPQFYSEVWVIAVR